MQKKLLLDILTTNEACVKGSTTTVVVSTILYFQNGVQRMNADDLQAVFAEKNKLLIQGCYSAVTLVLLNNGIDELSLVQFRYKVNMA